MQMVNKIFNRINQLKDDEDNYAELKNIEEKLDERLRLFISEKIETKKNNELELKKIIDDIKKVGRITS